MFLSSLKRTVPAAGLMAVVAIQNPREASAQDFSSLFDGVFGGISSRPSPAMSYAPDSSGNVGVVRRSATRSAEGTYCVRTCDGRYFPLPGANGPSKTDTCNSFCPASETIVFTGGSIDDAAADNGKRYTDLPNAFRFRNELVSDCTCNGRDPVGLVQIEIEHDRTLRRGDLVAGASEMMVAGAGAGKRRAALQLSPASSSVQARYSQSSIVAAQ